MSETRILFDDGAAYDRGMGQWSLVAGQVFLDWLAPDPGLRWLDGKDAPILGNALGAQH